MAGAVGGDEGKKLEPRYLVSYGRWSSVAAWNFGSRPSAGRYESQRDSFHLVGLLALFSFEGFHLEVIEAGFGFGGAADGQANADGPVPRRQMLAVRLG